MDLMCATRTPTSGAQFTTVIDSFRLLTGTRSDTIKRCAPIQTETTVLGCLTMAAGERPEEFTSMLRVPEVRMHPCFQGCAVEEQWEMLTSIHQ
jgi:hypothetical protein